MGWFDNNPLDCKTHLPAASIKSISNVTSLGHNNVNPADVEGFGKRMGCLGAKSKVL
jgi:hypothetical protein